MTTKKNVALLMISLAAIASIGSASAFLPSLQTQTSSNQNSKGDLGVMGHITLAVYGPDGVIKAYRQTDNLVVGAGANYTANKLFGTNLVTKSGNVKTATGTFVYIGVGTGVTGPIVGDTDLGAVRSSHLLGTASNSTTSLHGQLKVTGTFAANRLTNSSATNISESGLFDDVHNGTTLSTMFARQTFTAISVNPADTLAVTWTVQVAP